MPVVSTVSKLILATVALSLYWTSVAGANENAPATLPFEMKNTSPPDEAAMQADLRRIISKDLKEIHENGFLSVSEDEVKSFMLGHLAPSFVDPSDLAERTRILYGLASSAPLLKFEGVIGIIAPSGPNRYYSVIRVYTLPGDITVTLEETDFASIGAKVSQVKEMINTEINGHAGTATYRRAPNRKGLILVSWITESRLLKLSLAGAGVGPEQQATALVLARAVGKQ